LEWKLSASERMPWRRSASGSPVGMMRRFSGRRVSVSSRAGVGAEPDGERLVGAVELVADVEVVAAVAAAGTFDGAAGQGVDHDRVADLVEVDLDDPAGGGGELVVTRPGRDLVGDAAERRLRARRPPGVWISRVPAVSGWLSASTVGSPVASVDALRRLVLAASACCLAMAR
jgi:hypothetical protein